jgi:hypothetical protein
MTLDEAKALLGDGVVGEPLPDMPLPDPRSLLPDISVTHTYRYTRSVDLSAEQAHRRGAFSDSLDLPGSFYRDQFGRSSTRK